LNHLPLTLRQPDQVLAYCNGQAVTVGQFLGEVQALAEDLPAARYVINLCEDRYRFARAFAGAIVAGKTNLLPPNRLDTTIAQLHDHFPGARVISDDEADAANGKEPETSKSNREAMATPTTPEIPAEHLAAIVFTSGSSGQATAVEKPWRTLYESTLINANQMALADGPTTQVVASVPPQHMYGLETSVLIPLLGNAASSNAQPFLPADIAEALSGVPKPRVLVSTPPHLRTLADPAIQLPSVDRIWSATAPLDPKLAANLENQHGTQVSEIYGCSEVGCMAWRAPAQEETWTLFPGFELAPDGEQTVASAPHLPGSYQLQDHLEHVGPSRFRITGRSEDLVNIAGKRTSLAHLNQTLLRIPGVEDGVIFPPPAPDTGDEQRLAALVVAPNLTAEALRRALRDQVDEVFLPRPIRLVKRLPRTETGKLPRKAILDLYQKTENG